MPDILPLEPPTEEKSWESMKPEVPGLTTLMRDYVWEFLLCMKHNGLPVDPDDGTHELYAFARAEKPRTRDVEQLQTHIWREAEKIICSLWKERTPAQETVISKQPAKKKRPRALATA